MSKWKTAYHTIGWGGVTGDATGVTSVKDLFYRSFGDVEQAISEIAALGYLGIEVFDGNLLDYEDDPARFRAITEQHGVELVAVYSGACFIYADAVTDELNRIRRAAEMAADCGSTFLVVGGGAQRSTGVRDGDHERLVDGLDAVVEIADELGLDAVLHPHLTTIVENPDQIAAVLADSRIGLCADTAHLAAGGGDPAQMIHDHADRLRYVHLKDLVRETTTFAPLGQGDLDLSGIAQALRDIDYVGWVTVELDAYDGDPQEAAKISSHVLADLQPER